MLSSLLNNRIARFQRALTIELSEVAASLLVLAFLGFLLMSDATSSVFTHPMDFYRLGYPSAWMVTRTGPNGAIIAPVDGVQSSRAGDDVTHGVIGRSGFPPNDKRLPLILRRRS